ncbi:MAG: hypothetical protein H0V92_09880, partial [Pseudonocardiales bacterium]|nr:hypothetical protein [Pseudonocardiales bacterium]
VFAMYLPGTLLGGLLLFVGLSNSKVIPRWAGALGAVSVVLGFFAGDAFLGSDLVWSLLLSAALLPALQLAWQESDQAADRVASHDARPPST